MSGCRVTLANRPLELTPDQARALLEVAERDGTVRIAAFYFDCLVGVGGDVVLADGERLARRAAAVTQ